MARDFFNYSPYKALEFDEVAVRGLIRQLLVAGCIICNDKGFIAGVLTPLFFAPSILVATELAWWAPGASGTELREMFEHWAQASGASAVQMSTLNNGFAAQLAGNLTDNGYSPVEVAYLKAL